MIKLDSLKIPICPYLNTYDIKYYYFSNKIKAFCFSYTEKEWIFMLVSRKVKTSFRKSYMPEEIAKK